MKPFFDMSMLAALGYLALFLLAGVFVRARFKIFQKFLIPACLIGGVLGIFFLNTSGLYGVGPSEFKAIAYHTFTLTFICIALAGFKNDSVAKPGKTILQGSVWMFIMFYLSLALQALAAVGIFYVLNLFYGGELLPSAGFLCAQGFTQGPGQAVSTGLLWEKFGQPNMGDVAMSFASIGFLSAFLLGIPLANWGIRRKLGVFPAKEIDSEISTGILKPDSKVVAGYQVTHSINVDSLAFMLSLVLGVWLISYIIAAHITPHVSQGVGGTIWGLFFLLAIAMAFIVRIGIDKLNLGHLIDRGLLSRISGVMVEFVLLSTVTGISISALGAYVIPIIITSLLVTGLTFAYILYFGRRVPGNSFERTVMMYGTCTGTTPTGLILLRLVDNEFKTTVPIESGLWNIGSIVGSMITGTLVHGVVVYNWGMPLTLAGFAAIAVVCLICLKLFGLWTKEKQF